MTQLTIIVCTRNRADELRANLPKVRRSAEASGAAVVVVDNGSSDDSVEVAEALLADCPEARVIVEPRLGLSHARNTGVRVATTELVAFIDDDAYPDPDWPAELGRAMADTQAAGAGGPIVGDWSPAGGVPPWFHVDTIGSRFSLVQGPAEQVEMRWPTFPFGTNMAFRRSALLEHGGFSGAFGRKGDELLAFEEGDLFYRLQSSGHTTVWVPTARVHHRIPAQRAEPRYVLRRSWYDGLSRSAFDRLRSDTTRDRVRAVGAGLRLGQAAVRLGRGTASGQLRASQAGLGFIADACYYAGRAAGAFVNVDPG